MNTTTIIPENWGTKEHANKWFEKIANYKENEALREILVNYEIVENE